MIMGVSELQKNISIIRNLKESLQVIDKKTNEVLAIITPVNNKNKQDDITVKLAGIFSDYKLPEKYNGDLDAAIEDAYHMEMMKRYGHLNEK